MAIAKSKENLLLLALRARKKNYVLLSQQLVEQKL
jgi:hypothetical protein